MKKTWLTLLLAIPLLSFAQNNYLPILEDGKNWCAIWKFPTGEELYKMEAKGVTVLLDKKCKIVHITYIDIEFDSYYYEEDGKLFKYRNDGTFWLIFDIGMTETGWHNEFYNHPIYVYNIKKSQVIVNGQKRLCLIVDYDMDNQHSDYPAQDIWIEGIGKIGDTPLMSFNGYALAGGNGYLNYCSLNGDMLFTQEDFNQIAGIQSAITEYLSENCHDIYDLQGRKVTTPQKNGLYIKNGRKYLMK